METVDKAELTEEEKAEREALIAAVVADAIEISDRFSPEPVFGPTGKGYLKSEGVEPLKKIKQEQAGEDQ